MKHILVFGSLRKNSKRGYNFGRCGEQNYIKDLILDGFEMYSVRGYYPAISQGDGKIKCELHTVDEKTYDRIYSMERGAGYSHLTMKIDNIDATIFVMSKDQTARFEKVESGDWN